MTNLQIESEYCQELWAYAGIGINDNRTDGDSLIWSWCLCVMTVIRSLGMTLSAWRIMRNEN